MSLFSVFSGKSARRSSLRNLLELDERRLTDLGLTRFDVFEAMRYGIHAGDILTARRAERAGYLAR
jgi:uncharacterized protein YjiS (DUF1127 family)